jgi:site-specific recombinase XerD
MAKFAKSEKQSADVMKQLQGNIIRSVRTVANYEQALKNVCDWVKAERISKEGLEGINRSQAIQYLEQRAEQVGQKTLDMERQAIQAMQRHVTGALNPKETLPTIQSEKPQILASRAYSKEQIEIIACSQNDKNALATQIAHASGLRAHELLTLQKIEHQAPDQRPAMDTKFTGRVGQGYSVIGKPHF